MYYHQEGAEMAKKFLDQKEFNTRKVKISLDRPKDESENNEYSALRNRFQSLRKEEKSQFFSYLKILRDEQG